MCVKKKILLVLSGVMITSLLLASEENISEPVNNYEEAKVQYNMYGAVSVGSTQINGKSVVVNSIGAGYMINKNIYVGIKGSLFTNINNNLQFNDLGNNTNAYLKGGYAGFIFQPIVGQYKWVNITFPCLLGVGGVWYNNNDAFIAHSKNSKIIDSDLYYLVEPGVELEFKLIRNINIGLGISYRNTSGVNMANTSYDLLNGLNTSFTIRVGRF